MNYDTENRSRTCTAETGLPARIARALADAHGEIEDGYDGNDVPPAADMSPEQFRQCIDRAMPGLIAICTGDTRISVGLEVNGSAWAKWHAMVIPAPGRGKRGEVRAESLRELCAAVLEYGREAEVGAKGKGAA